MVYDSAGNLTNDGAHPFTYDTENRLATAGGVTYTYDGDGKRVKKSNGTLYWIRTLMKDDHLLPLRPIANAAIWLVLVSIPSLAKQQSYRSYQLLSGRALRSIEQPKRNSSHPGTPMRFQGWSIPASSDRTT
jgi:hypothetical protein